MQAFFLANVIAASPSIRRKNTEPIFASLLEENAANCDALFFRAVIFQLKEWQETSQRQSPVPQLICRICEQKVALDKYMVNDDSDVSRCTLTCVCRRWRARRSSKGRTMPCSSTGRSSRRGSKSSRERCKPMQNTLGRRDRRRRRSCFCRRSRKGRDRAFCNGYRRTSPKI
jgi:hypothetical protein